MDRVEVLMHRSISYCLVGYLAANCLCVLILPLMTAPVPNRLLLRAGLCVAYS